MFDNKPSTPQVIEEINITREDLTAQSAEQIFNRAPSAYKRFITFGDWLMVTGGLKAATDYGFVGDTWNQNDFDQLKTALETEGLKVTDPTIREGTNIPFREGHIYNPATLKEQTAHSSYAPPYDGVTPLDQYISTAEAQGYSFGAIYGKIYSFPESAIADFITQEMGISIQGEERQNASHNNETYWFIVPAKPDVIKREQDKNLLPFSHYPRKTASCSLVKAFNTFWCVGCKSSSVNVFSRSK